MFSALIMTPVSDPSSFSTVSKCATKHLNLIYHVDFDKRVLKGKVALTLEVLEDKFSSLILNFCDDAALQDHNHPKPQVLISLLRVPVYCHQSPFLISLQPHSMCTCEDLWVECRFLEILSFVQSCITNHSVSQALCFPSLSQRATHCRSMIPCQDSPSVKHTYYAQVSVPKELVALMSALHDGQVPDPSDSSRVIYRFRQPVPMPSYLIAIVVGALESRKIGPRSRVWSEKENVDEAAFEFSETETMLKTAESLAGPYVWGQYDLLVMPPSFPYGGMENPCLTFVTPTVLAGDKSLAGVIAHEISHSWTGNLVTNRNWEHFWLNEGHTVYIERMIARCMESEHLRQFKGIGGWKELQESVNQFGANNVLTNLVPNLHEVDTDEAFSSVPYEKGFALLYHLEELLGGPEVFMGFVKSYIQLFAYGTVTTEEWKNYLFTYFKDKVDILNKVDWNAWMHTPGMAPVKPKYDTTMADACTALCQRWVKAKEEDLASFTEEDVKKLNSPQLIEFMALLLQEEPLPLSHVKKMQEVYQLNSVKNAEVRFRWLRICVRAHWEEAVPLALKMATEQGRMKFTRPLFKEVYNFSKYSDKALNTFKENRGALHPVTAMLVAKDLKING
uniref:Leukotriene A4 hydrolase n=1 Tax=Cyprinus carpio TaxID=7962 RepID=A0A8C2DAK9_CYPCA